MPVVQQQQRLQLRQKQRLLLPKLLLLPLQACLGTARQCCSSSINSSSSRG
jgi:hypothetical protein